MFFPIGAIHSVSRAADSVTAVTILCVGGGTTSESTFVVRDPALVRQAVQAVSRGGKRYTHTFSQKLPGKVQRANLIVCGRFAGNWVTRRRILCEVRASCKRHARDGSNADAEPFGATIEVWGSG